MPYTPEQVRQAVDKVWPRGRAKLGRTALPRAGDWAQCMQAQGESCMKIVREAVAARDVQAGGQDSKAHGQKLQQAVRHASNWPCKKVMPLFVTGGFVRAKLDKAWRLWLTEDERKPTDEHVVPVTHTVNGLGSLGRPEDLFAALARAMIAPICRVIGYEDRRIPRTDIDDWTRPFDRYAAPSVTRLGEPPIEVYRSADGTLVDVAGFTWDHWLAEMDAHPLYTSGRQFFEREFRKRFAESWAAIFAGAAALKPPALPPVGRDNGNVGAHNFTPDEVEHIQHGISEYLGRADVPLTAAGHPSIRVPVGRSRVQVVQRSHSHDELFCINIGPERRKFELYHNPERHHAPEGRARLIEVHRQIRQGIQLIDRPPNDVRHAFGYHRAGPGPFTAERAVRDTIVCIDAMLAAYDG